MSYLKSNLRNHPAATLLAMGVPITINPDDNAPFGYDNVVYDWLMAFLSWDMDLFSLKQLGYNSLYYSSISKKDRDCAIKAYFKLFEKWVDEMLNKVA